MGHNLGESAVTLARDAPVDAARSLDDVDDALSPSIALLVVAVAGAVVAQGAFEGPSRWFVGGVVALVLLTAGRRVRTATTSGGALALSAGGLAMWVLVRAVMTDNLASGGWQVALIAGVAVVVAACRRATTVELDTLTLAVVAIGLFVAMTGWVGAAFRVEPWVNPGPTSWRASSTITYPNAAAALIVVALLIALARGRGASLSRLDAAGCAVLFAGLAATQSRGGAVALLVGLVVLGLVAGLAPVARATLAPLVGGAAAFGISISAFDANGPARPLLMFVGLGVGVSLAVGIASLPRRVAALLWLPVAAAPVVLWTVRGRLADAASDRFSTASGDRGGTTRAALELFQDHPIGGLGPGNLNLVWKSGDRLVTTGLVHNEYLQVLAELGAVGALLLAGCFVIAIRMVVSSRLPSPSASWCGGAAALAALAAHSALDFLWHIPVVPLVAAVVFGVVASGRRVDVTTRDATEQIRATTTIDAHPAVDQLKGNML